MEANRSFAALLPMKADPAPTRVDLAHTPAFSLGPLQVRPPTRELVAATAREVLQPRIMQVLVALARSGGEVVSRDDLIHACWDGRVVGDDAINRCIAKLRDLGEAHGAFAIETIARVGYRLSPQVQSGDPEPSSDASIAIAAAETEASPLRRAEAAMSPLTYAFLKSPTPLSAGTASSFESVTCSGPVAKPRSTSQSRVRWVSQYGRPVR
jgi:DNA-binding winged helix-turn-helix (wHTH) protein